MKTRSIIGVIVLFIFAAGFTLPTEAQTPTQVKDFAPVATGFSEVSFVGEWYPRENLWLNVNLGYSRPGDALAPSGLGNPLAFLNAGAAPVGTRSSVDAVFATSWGF